MSDKDEIDRLVNWEGRPAALMRSGAAFAVLDATSGWVKVSWDEVVDSGDPISEAKFDTRFPKSDISKIPGISAPDDKMHTLSTTITVPRARALSSSEDEGPHEYLRTYKASEDRWANEAMGRVLARKQAREKAAKRKKKGKKEDKDR